MNAAYSSKRKLLIFGIATLFLLITSGVLYTFIFSPTTACLLPKETIIVTMDTDGFAPEDITIQTCTAIVFQNKDSRLRWPASDYHPTHGIFPEFDPQRGIEPDKSWSFVFERQGQWRFHDHLIPNMRGTITVHEE